MLSKVQLSSIHALVSDIGYRGHVCCYAFLELFAAEVIAQ